MAVDIARQTVSHKKSRTGQTAVGTSLVNVVPDANYDVARGILLKAAGSGDASANTVPIFVGFGDNSTSEGFSIAPGEALHLPIIDPTELTAISTSASQTLFWFIL